MPDRPKPTPEFAAETAISLDELAKAFAQVMGGTAQRGDQDAEVPPQEAETTAEAADQPPVAEASVAEPQRPPRESDDSCPINPRTIFEAMLFVGDGQNRSLSAQQAAELMRGVEPREIPGLVQAINERYARSGRPYTIESDSEGYQLVLRPEFQGLRSRFFRQVREARLSQAAIDVLAIVAYQQPLTGEEVGRLRGKPSNHVLAQLVHRRLLRIERKAEKRRTAQYFTTERFLKLFGLQTLADLPQSEELDRQ
jgi:segregation and condensation protein B